MWFDIDFPEEVIEELADESYANRKHYSRATYALGCRGPLCRRKEKDRGRIRNEEKAKANGREYRPGQHRLGDDLGEVIDRYLVWYESQMTIAS